MPDDVPAARAVLAGTVETAVNALWDAAPLVGDRVTVVGAGMVGCCVAAAAGPVPRRRRSRWSTSTRPGRASRPRSASSSPCPADAAGGRDLVVHASATAAGLQRSLDLLAPEGTVIELSWYGDRAVRLVARRGVPLRPARASAAARSARSPRARRRRTHARDRLALALDLLRDPAFDALLTGASRVRGAARGDGPAGARAACPRSATRITYDRRE